VIRVYAHTGNVIETHERNGEFRSHEFSSHHVERPVKRVADDSFFIGSGPGRAILALLSHSAGPNWGLASRRLFSQSFLLKAGNR
jgi:hypothetical protein